MYFFFLLDLKNDEYTFGRGENCDVSFSVQMAKNKQCFQAYSKVHFKLIKVFCIEHVGTSYIILMGYIDTYPIWD